MNGGRRGLGSHALASLQRGPFLNGAIERFSRKSNTRMDSNPRLVVESVTPPAFRNGIRRDRSGLCEGPQMRFRSLAGALGRFRDNPRQRQALTSRRACLTLRQAISVGTRSVWKARLRAAFSIVRIRLAVALRARRASAGGRSRSACSERPWAGWRACCASDLNHLDRLFLGRRDSR